MITCEKICGAVIGLWHLACLPKCIIYQKKFTHLPAFRSSAFFINSNVSDGMIRCDVGTGYNAFESDTRYQLRVQMRIERWTVTVNGSNDKTKQNTEKKGKEKRRKLQKCCARCKMER